MDPSSPPPPAYSERPPIPPRKPVNSSTSAIYQTPPSAASSSTSTPGPYMHTLSSGPWLGPDPRSSSTQSLLPDTSRDSQAATPADYLGRRKLLIIYIHGFLGNDQSFRSFPAHVHALLANLLAESHVIHSKIYPRYKTYRSVGVARDNFSEWLRPHESPNTDVVLVGHSMGGILAADVVLMPNPSPYGLYPFKHRIIGHVSLDCPFIGLHPGIVVSGITSLFKPAPTPPQDSNQKGTSGTTPNSPEASIPGDPSVSSLYLTNSQSTDPGSSTSLPSIASSSQPQRDPFANQPYFNQPFFNDSGLQERPFVQRMFHFANKYPNTTCPETRYAQSNSSASSSSVELDFLQNKISIDERIQPHTRQESPLPIITLEHRDTLGNSRDHQTLLDSDAKARASDTTIKDNPVDDYEALASDINRLSMQSIDPTPIDEESLAHPLPDTATLTFQDEAPIDAKGTNNSLPGKEEADLPPLPDPPTTPDIPDPSLYTEKDERKQVEREAKRIRRAHENALKDHAKAVREREKLIEKRQKRSQKEAEKALKEAARQEKEALKESQRKEKESQKEEQRLIEEASEHENEAQKMQEHEDTQRTKNLENQYELEAEAEAITKARGLKSSKPRKLRKFCNLPTKGGRIDDPTWVDIYMADVDEVGAHCGLFFAGQHYEKLVGDVGNRIMGWVQDDMTKRTIQDMEKGTFK
ncbi:Reticulocyte-binding protein 2 like protein a [Fusarium oxysporum f. sp. cubense race 1]|uniref:Reticulocyte-binding protein 2 like protein a n=1 Tax=Fusarium oxysporum f. sp. cubense (strain race 1) TaxID=1229664 RepID=N4TZ55_FUSC1|nr:Reticulocyte-binding protein 2 like protein a [Fusarium oxysporum f. sp. cubense race 1]